MNNVLGPHVVRKAGENNPHEDTINDVFIDDEPVSSDGCNLKTVEKKRCDSCGRMFKGDLGVAIHFGKVHKTKTITQDAQTQRSQVPPRRKTRGSQDQEAHHRVQEPRESASSDVPDAESQETINPPVSDSTKRKKLRWPHATDKKWNQLDEDLEATLNSALRGTASEKLKQMTSITYAMGETRFETKGPWTQEKGKAGPSRRQREMANIRKDLRSLRDQWKHAADFEKDGLRCLRDDLRLRLATLRKAENKKRKSAEKRKAQSSFYKGPFKFVSDLLGKPKSGRLICSTREAEDTIASVHCDPQKDEPLPVIPIDIPIPVPKVTFDESSIKLSEVQAVVKRARSGSAPGASGIPYVVYKNCPRLVKRLWKILSSIWQSRDIPDAWTRAEGCFVPKELNSNNIDQFREISLLDVEGKIFWSIISKRMNTYLLDNHYIDTSVQKGGISGISGCLEHTAVITQLIHEARKEKNSLAVVWLDLERAYPSLPHKVISYALHQYHFPSFLADLILTYLRSMKMRFNVGSEVTSWQKLERGIMAGCTVSVVLFVVSMDVIIKGAQSECRGPTTTTGVRQPSCRAFMDDLTAMTPSVTGTRWVLRGLEKMVKWARMRFKAKKSRTLTIVKGKVKDQRYSVEGERIPTVGDSPIRCLGKVFDESLRDINNVSTVQNELSLWLKKIDATHLPGKFKAWCFQFGIIPRLQWPFLLYDFPISTVTRMEQQVSRHLRKWFGLPPSTASANLYSIKSPTPQPLSSTVEVFKTAKARAITTLRFSGDDKVKEASEAIGCGRLWKPQKEVNLAISRLKHKDVVGVVCKGRLGLGNYGNPIYSTARASVKRTMVGEEIRAIEEERRQSQLRNLSRQGDWNRWEHVLEKKTSWNDIWRTNETKLKFILRSVFDLLPSPTNLRVWGLSNDSRCTLCGAEYCNLRHILSSCKKSLSDGRYRWRHDEVLRSIAHSIATELKAVKQGNGNLSTGVQFVREGDKPRAKPSNTTPSGLLRRADDWVLLVDVDSKLSIPPKIVITNLRPDIVMYSNKEKMVILIELTVPWEDRFEESHQLKSAKYAGLVSDITSNGWRSQCFPVEVGTRGFPATSLRRMFIDLGFSSRKTYQVCKAAGNAAEGASQWLWHKRSDIWQTFRTS